MLQLLDLVEEGFATSYIIASRRYGYQLFSYLYTHGGFFQKYGETSVKFPKQQVMDIIL